MSKSPIHSNAEFQLMKIAKIKLKIQWLVAVLQTTVSSKGGKNQKKSHLIVSVLLQVAKMESFVALLH